MLVFKKIQYRNFLSTGNQINTIDLNSHGSTLITGKNGDGKSTVLCALTFGLFGRPFRNVNKGQLVNSINRKNCEVEVEFDVNGREYRILRGIKPNVFEIYCDGQLINQDAAAKDYQKVLEQQILKLNYKTFTQVVILGSATYVPFMQLSAAGRREVIEDILDIKIFSVMNSILKDKATATRERLVEIDTAIKAQKVKIEAQKKLIEVLVTSKQAVVDGLNAQIEANSQTIAETQERIASTNREIDYLKSKSASHDDIVADINKAKEMKAKLKQKTNTFQSDIDFFNSNDTCPSCSQNISEEYRTKIISDLDTKIDEHNDKMISLESILDKLNTKLKAVVNYLNQIRDLNLDISSFNTTVSLLNEQNANLLQDIKNAGGDTGNIEDEKAKQKMFAEEALDLVTTKADLLDERDLQEVASLLLKDTGVKTAIIREYLPIMNKLISKYLDAMNLYIKFELDESFSESIKSRNRDEFTYDSFSEGEKRRIDLAILFTWRQIAKMKNSVNTNLLFLDEILDSSLDSNGIDYFLTIMNEFGEHTNVFVISHRSDTVADKFNRVVKVIKKGDFSTIECVY